MTPTEALRREIEIARIAAEYAQAQDLGTKSRLLATIKGLRTEQNPPTGSRVFDEHATRL